MSVEIVGLNHLQKKLEALPAKVGKKVLRQAFRKHAKTAANKMKSIAASKPTAEGVTKKDVKVRSSKRSRVTFGVEVGVFGSPSIIPTEYGHKAGPVSLGGNRVFVQPSPIVRPGWESTKEQIKRAILQEVADGIEREAKRG